MMFKRLFIILLAVSFTCHGENYVIALDIVQQDNTIITTPQLNFKTSTAIKEAIDNGIRIQLIAKAQLFEPVPWWFDTTIGNQKINLEVSYFILGKLYVVKNKTTGKQLGFNDYEQLWQQFEKLIRFEFIAPKDDKAWIKLRIMLDKGGLPTAMQLPVLFNEHWDINTDWYYQQVKTDE
ncbi:hypothetical protein MNBD_GAMMA01-609 [hydrothermal vent metagenome]|uniref:DUF4390 domain-containing protein n=1 Tax=hydrothermal vent metagenome TaxID=652676 RepID=A0A3B0VQ30_9ZZZZ